MPRPEQSLHGIHIERLSVIDPDFGEQTAQAGENPDSVNQQSLTKDKVSADTRREGLRTWEIALFL